MFPKIYTEQPCTLHSSMYNGDMTTNNTQTKETTMFNPHDYNSDSLCAMADDMEECQMTDDDILCDRLDEISQLFREADSEIQAKLDIATSLEAIGMRVDY